MFLIEYALHLGSTKHYAPSAQAALSLVRDVEVSGGRVVTVTRTRDNTPMNADDLARLAAQEVGPVDPRPPSLLDAVRRLFDRQKR